MASAAPRCTDFGAEVAPEEVGLDSRRLENISRFMEGVVGPKGQMPHASAMVARDGQVCYWKGVGSIGDGRSVAPDTILRIYSMTKPITSVAIMMLVEEGRIHLHQPVHLFLGAAWKRANMKVFCGGDADEPEFEPCKRSITVQHLLTHTSGLTYGFDGMEFLNPVAKIYQRNGLSVLSGARSADDLKPRGDSKRNTLARRDGTLEQLCALVATLPLTSQPGTKFGYSISTDVLSRIVEVVSGQTFGAFVRERITEPLGMVDTGFTVAHKDVHRFADVHYHSMDGTKANLTASQRALGHYVPGQLMESGGGGLASTQRDYLRFAQCMLDGGVCKATGNRILSRKTVEQMTTNHLPGGATMTECALVSNDLVSLPGFGFGLGFAVCLDPRPTGMTSFSPGAFFWGGLANTTFWCDPSENMVVQFGTQVIGLDILRLPYQALLSNLVAGAVVDGALAPMRGGGKGGQLRERGSAAASGGGEGRALRSRL